MPLTDADRWTIGRTELKNGPQRLPGPQSMTQQGDTVRISGRFYSGDTVTQQTDMRIFRQQWLGLNELDVVPFVCPDDYDLTGFYRPVSAQFTAEKGGRDAGFGAYSVNLERLGGGYSSMIVEQINAMAGTNRPNDQSFINGQYWTVRPSVAEVYGLRPVTLTPVPTETGGVFYRSFSLSATLGLDRYILTPEQFYSAGCRIEARTGGAWYTVVGRQIPATPIDDIRITNGVIRVTFDGATDRIILQHWLETSQSWSTPHPFFIVANNSPNPTWDISAAPSVTVLRNDNTTVSIQVGLGDPDLSNYAPAVLTLTLFRAAPIVSCTMDALDNNATIDTRVRYDTWDGTTDISEQLQNFGGTITFGASIQSDAADADGLLWFATTNDAGGSTTASTKGDMLTLPFVTAVKQITFGLGLSYPATGSGLYDEHASAARGWFAPIATSERVVAR